MQLQDSSQAHPTFHMQLLEPYRVSREESHRRRPATLKPIEREVNYVIRGIVKSHRDNKKKRKPVEYFVLLEGYLNEEGTWKTYDKLKETAEEALQEFRAKNANAD